MYTKNTLADNKKLKKVGNDYYLGDKKVIPKEEIQEFLEGYYDDPATGMRGRDALYSKISKEYAGISRRTVAAFLANQETAQIHKEVPAAPITRPAVLRKEGQWAVDLTWLKKTDPAEKTSDLKDSQILFTCIDQFSKYAWVRILPNKQAGTVAKAMQSIIDDSKEAKTVMPTLVRSDNGSEFVAKAFGDVLHAVGCKQRFSQPHNPRQNAMIERFNKTIKGMVYKYLTQWNVSKIEDKPLQKLVSNYNNTRHDTIEVAPVEIHKAGSEPMMAKLAHHNMKARAEKLVAENKSTYPELAIGDDVRVARRTEGSWRATRQLKKYSYMKNWTYEIFKVSAKTRGSATKAVTYTLKDSEGNMLVEASDVPKQFIRQDLMYIKDPKAIIKELDRDEFVVEKVAGKKKIRGKPKYLVYWVGYDEPTWESPQESFKDAIDAYEKSIKDKGK